MIDFEKLVAELSKAWEEMKKFGAHEGECDLSEGFCLTHLANMDNRVNNMEKAIVKLKEAFNLEE